MFMARLRLPLSQVINMLSKRLDFLHMTYDHEEPSHLCANVLWAHGAEVPLSEHLQEGLASLSDDLGLITLPTESKAAFCHSGKPSSRTVPDRVSITPTCVRCCSDLERRAVKC